MQIAPLLIRFTYSVYGIHKKYIPTGNMIDERSIFTFSINSCYLWLYSHPQDFNFSIPKGTIYFTFFIADCTEPILFDAVLGWNYCSHLEWKKKPRPQNLHFPPKQHIRHSRICLPIKFLTAIDTFTNSSEKLSLKPLTNIHKINFSAWSWILSSDFKHHLVEVM